MHYVYLPKNDAIRCAPILDRVASEEPELAVRADHLAEVEPQQGQHLLGDGRSCLSM